MLRLERITDRRGGGGAQPGLQGRRRRKPVPDKQRKAAAPQGESVMAEELKAEEKIILYDAQGRPVRQKTSAWWRRA